MAPKAHRTKPRRKPVRKRATASRKTTSEPVSEPANLRKPKPERVPCPAGCKREPNKWAKAVAQAYKNLGFREFEPVKKGSALYKEAKRIMG